MKKIVPQVIQLLPEDESDGYSGGSRGSRGSSLDAKGY